MSQQGSSISNENPEAKYRKALMEIQKIHNANKVLKNQSEEMKNQYEHQIHQMALSFQQLQKENEAIKNQNVNLQKLYEELQMSNSEFRKDYMSLQREVSYLNDVLTQQNTELKKINAFKDQKGLSALITSYQDREIAYRKDISRYQDLVKSLKTSCETLEEDLSEERRQRHKLQDLNNGLRMEINKYRQLNNSLLNKNQSIVSSLQNRNSEGREKYREAQSILSQIGRQLELVKNSRIEQQALQRATVSLDSYESVLHEKNRLEGEIQRLRQKMGQSESKTKQMFEVEEKMKKATIRAEQLQEQCNMLKSRLVVVQTKEIMDAWEDVGLKQIEQRVILNIGQNDPLPAIKNSSDSSHFQLMKAYIVQLKDKLSKALAQKKEYQKKYRSIKQKVGQKAQKALGLQEQNKLIRGKLQGFERLAQRLQFELQRNIESHEEQINKMKSMTAEIISKKAEQTKVANAFVRAQLDLQLDKFDRIEKGLRQQIDTLKLQLSTQRIKNNDLQDKLSQANEFLSIYKTKFQELQVQNSQVQETHATLQENAMRFQQLYREQRAKNEALIQQKQALTTKISEMSQQNESKFQVENEWRQKQVSYQSQIRKLKAQISQGKSQMVQLQNNLKIASRQADQKSRLSGSEIAKSQGGYYNSLEQNYQQEKQKNRLLQSELSTLKLRAERANAQVQKTATLQDALAAKADELNDLKRKTIGFQKQVGILQAQMSQIRNQYEKLKKENTTLKAKLLENGQEIRKSYESKEIQNKRLSQRMSEELTSSTSELRQEKRTNARLQTELQSIKNQLRRYEDLIEQVKRKQSATSEQLNELRNIYETTNEQNQRYKSEIKYKSSLQQGLNTQINGLQQKVFKLTQENTELRLKMQSIDNDFSELKRQLGGLKVYVNQIEDYANVRNPNGGWQEQRDKDNLANFVQRLKKIIRTSEISQGNNIYDYRANNFNNTYSSNALPDYLKTYIDPPSNTPKINQNSLQSSPFTLNLGQNFGEGSYKYRDYLQ